MIDPYKLSQVLRDSPSVSSFFEDDIIIKVYLEGGWLIKGRNNNGVITIHPTDYGTIMFSFPVVLVPVDKVFMSMVAQMDAMNGTINLVPNEEDDLTLVYTVYIPADFKDFEEHGNLIRTEVRSLKQRITQMMIMIGDAYHDQEEASSQTGNGPSFSADSFNKMMKEITSKTKEDKKSNPKSDNEDSTDTDKTEE